MTLRIQDHRVETPGPGEVHYFNHGGFGAIRLREPMVLGHEVPGHVTGRGAGVIGLKAGQLVAVPPSRLCGACRYCREAANNHCLNMRFFGSAKPFPHVQGAFREVLVAHAAQCAPAAGFSAGEAAMAKPLAVCLQAARRAAPFRHRRRWRSGPPWRPRHPGHRCPTRRRSRPATRP
ncbi:MAG: hypothetical protein C0524_06040 [Rhodobacter sp.]|nr:hypothetical protein [Rhodobacter sp.]